MIKKKSPFDEHWNSIIMVNDTNVLLLELLGRNLANSCSMDDEPCSFLSHEIID